MAKYQFPIDGKLGKDFKITSLMGFRIHPVKKVKKHHNGTDIWSPHEPCWIEAPAAATVINIGNNPAGFGNSVTLRMKINGKIYVSVFAHMQNGSIKVKKGQRITAGTPLGKMGTTGMSTGKHLHWELQLGKNYHWNDVGKDFIEPIAFFKALIAHEASISTAKVVAKDTDPVAPAPTHDAVQAKKVEAARLAEKKAAAATKPVAKPVAKPAVKTAPATAVSKAPAKAVAKAPAKKVANPGYPGVYIKSGSSGIAVKYLQQQLKVPVTGTVNPATVAAVKALQKRHKLSVDGVVGPLTWAKLG